MTGDNTTMANWMFYLARKLTACPPDRREQEMAFVAASLKEQAMILLKSTTEPELLTAARAMEELYDL